MTAARIPRSDRPVIYVDGRRLTAHATGVGRYLSLLLESWAEAVERLPFEPVVILHQERPGHLDSWRQAFTCEVIGSRAPGWVWENFCLAALGRREGLLFAPANLVPRRWRGPVVLVVHDTFCEHADAQIPWKARLRFRQRYRYSARRADLVLTPSEATAGDVRRHFGVPDERIRVIRPGLRSTRTDVTPDEIRKYAYLADSPFVLFVGKTSARRDFPAIAEAVEHISLGGRDLKLIRVGPPMAEPVRTETLIDLGHVPDSVLSWLYGHARAMVWPSAREGFGLPVLEAMAHGCPVISRPLNALAELCDGACLALPDTKPESIAAAILALIEDGEQRRRLIRQGLDRAKAFDGRTFADEVAGAIASVLTITRRATSGAESRA
ncbi:glycosyltransferase [bacterium]|nr:glycosyltransferase [bacterium]